MLNGALCVPYFQIEGVIYETLIAYVHEQSRTTGEMLDRVTMKN